jgi:hypothetical protein
MATAQSLMTYTPIRKPGFYSSFMNHFFDENLGSLTGFHAACEHPFRGEEQQRSRREHEHEHARAHHEYASSHAYRTYRVQLGWQ